MYKQVWDFFQGTPVNIFQLLDSVQKLQCYQNIKLMIPIINQQTSWFFLKESADISVANSLDQFLALKQALVGNTELFR